MKTIRRNFYASAVLRIVCFFSILFFGLFARAVEVDLFAAVRAVDDERVAATVAADKVRLDLIYSDGLRYATLMEKSTTRRNTLPPLPTKKRVMTTSITKFVNFDPRGPVSSSCQADS